MADIKKLKPAVNETVVEKVLRNNINHNFEHIKKQISDIVIGTGFLPKVNYDSNDDGIVNEADYVDWIGVRNKPSTFAPSSHFQDISTISGLQDSLDGKVVKELGKALSTNDYTDAEKNKLDSIQDNANYYIHPASHSVSEVSGLQTELDGKAILGEDVNFKSIESVTLDLTGMLVMPLSGGTVKNKWLKLATIELSSYIHSYNMSRIMIFGTNILHSRYDTAIIDFGAKRQNGSILGDGNTLLKVSQVNGLIAQNFRLVVEQDDENGSIVDLYIKFPANWLNFNYTKIVTAGNGTGATNLIDYTDNRPTLSLTAPPDGLAQFEAEYFSMKTSGFLTGIKSVSSNYTPTDDDHTLLVDCSGGQRYITLSGIAVRGKELIVKKIDSSSNIARLVGTIDGFVNYDLGLQNQFVKVKYTGSNWIVVGE